jgi:hypothetical protein
MRLDARRPCGGLYGAATPARKRRAWPLAPLWPLVPPARPSVVAPSPRARRKGKGCGANAVRITPSAHRRQRQALKLTERKEAHAAKIYAALFSVGGGTLHFRPTAVTSTTSGERREQAYRVP